MVWFFVAMVVGLAPLGVESTTGFLFFLNRTLLLLIGLVCVFSSRHEPELHFSPAFYVALAGFFGLMLLSVLAIDGSRFDGYYVLYKHGLLAFFFVAVAMFNRRQSLRWKVLLLGTTIAITMVYLGATLVTDQRPIIGPFSNHNYFASFLLIGFAASVAIFCFQRRLPLRILAAACSLLFFYGVTEAWSRGASVAALAVIAVAFWRMGNRPLLVGVLVLLIGVIAANPDLARKFLDSGKQDPYNYLRPYIWTSTVQIIAEHPWFGMGAGQYYYVAKEFNFPVEGTIARYMKVATIAHSEYLHYAAEIGIPATVLLLSLAGYVVFKLAQRSRTVPEDARFLQEAGILVVVGIGTHGLVDNNWVTPVLCAALVVLSLGELSLRWPSPLRFQWSRTRLAIALLIVLAIYGHSTVIPALGVYYNEVGQKSFRENDLAGAERFHKLAVAIIPDHPVFLDNLGMVYFLAYLESKDVRLRDLAEIYFLRAAAANPRDDQPLRHMEMLLIQGLSGNVEGDRSLHLRIIEIDRKILAVSPFNASTQKNLAEALYYVGRREEALRELSGAIELEPNFVSAYRLMAAWYQNAGNQDQSEAYIDKANAIEARFKNFVSSEPYENLLLGRSTGPVVKR